MRTLAKKQAAREARNERKQLVHAAGCTHATCISKWFVISPEWARDTTLVAQGAKVPRSLRRYLGLQTGYRP